jgi:putative transcriptional regulator
MPIIVNLDVMLAKRKMRLNTVAELVDITAPNLSILKTGKAKAIRFSTLEKLCEILECQPGDILEYRKEDRSQGGEPGRAVGAVSEATSVDRG